MVMLREKEKKKEELQAGIFSFSKFNQRLYFVVQSFLCLKEPLFYEAEDFAERATADKAVIIFINLVAYTTFIVKFEA